ncbi:virulence factor TspB C-terminal domain-related protein [Photobacterium piscicola]|uniref:Virulence factor TspB C-terminal domain-related protein n=1 Tax=Photobacterium piscicola TaxID=1378299 RepID=A0ABU6LD25_9GAMM|nr:virulence factor TspB C-terminal domain-related protein [Photobacterium piscicola]
MKKTILIISMSLFSYSFATDLELPQEICSNINNQDPNIVKYDSGDGPSGKDYKVSCGPDYYKKNTVCTISLNINKNSASSYRNNGFIVGSSSFTCSVGSGKFGCLTAYKKYSYPYNQSNIGEVCEKPNKCKDKPKNSFLAYFKSSQKLPNLCNDGCGATPFGGLDKTTTLDGMYFGAYKWTGEDCVISEGSSEGSLEPLPPQHEFCNEWGGFDGASYCDKNSSNYKPDPDKPPLPDIEEPEKPNPDGGDGEKPNPDGGEGEKPNPDGGGGEKPNPDGGDGGKPNPDGGSGSDNSDVIDYLKDFFGSAAGSANDYKNSNNNLKEQLNKNEIDFSNSKFDESGFLGAATCPPPIQIEVMSFVIELPLNFFCQLAETLAPLIVGLAYLLAARMIMSN